MTSVDDSSQLMHAIDKHLVVRQDAFTQEVDWKEFRETGRHKMMTKYRQHRIDLFNPVKRRFPTGRLGYILEWCRENAVQYQCLDTRVKPERQFDSKYIGHPCDGSTGFAPRPYQEESPKKVSEIGRGVLWHATASGKTVTAARTINLLGVNTLYMVPSQDLLHQTASDLEEVLEDVTIGKCGDGEWNPKQVTVATTATLWSRFARQECKDLLESTNLLIGDECFVSSTLIGGVTIENIQVGDYVPSFKQHVLHRENKKVTHVFKNRPKTNILIELRTESGRKIICTPRHPIAVRGYFRPHGFKAADELKKGDVLIAGDDYDTWDTLDSITIHKQTRDGTFGGVCTDGYVYNLEVEDNHTYIANGIGVHNCHHVQASGTKDKNGVVKEVNSWYIIALACEAYYRVGMTGTPGKDIEQKRSFLECAFGRVIDRVSSRELIELGVIANVDINMHKIKHTQTQSDYPTARKLGIIMNTEFNRYLVDIAIQELEAGKNVLLLTGSKQHQGPLLVRLFAERGFHDVPFVSGGTLGKARRKAREDFKAGKLKCLIGTVYKEGINFPLCDCGILCDGGKDEKKTIQFLGRILRKGKDAKTSTLHDFFHEDAKYLKKHSNNRLKTYMEEELDSIIMHKGITIDYKEISDV